MNPGFCFPWLCLVLLALPAGAWVTPAIEIVSPAPVSRAGDALLLRVRLRLGGGPFTEGGNNRWCQMTIRNHDGRTVAQAVLRDNGGDFDEKSSDGEWTAPVRLQLPPGNYSMYVTVNAGAERASEHGEFVVTPPETKPTPPESGPDQASAIKEQIGKLTKEVHALGSRRFPATGWIGLLAVAVAGLAVWLTLQRHPTQKLIEPQQDLPPVPAANWKPLFSCFESIQSSVTSMKQDLSSTYQMQRRVLDERIKLARELVSLSLSLESAETLDGDLTQALKANLEELLLNAGVGRWDPVIGSSAPAESEQRPAKNGNGGSPLTVTRVLRPGFRMREGEGWLVLVRPVVEVVPARREKEIQ